MTEVEKLATRGARHIVRAIIYRYRYFDRVDVLQRPVGRRQFGYELVVMRLELEVAAEGIVEVVSRENCPAPGRSCDSSLQLQTFELELRHRYGHACV